MGGLLNALVAEETGELPGYAQIDDECLPQRAAELTAITASAPGAAGIDALIKTGNPHMQKLVAALLAKAKHSQGDQALVDMALCACDRCLKIAGLSVEEKAHMAKACDHLCEAGAAPSETSSLHAAGNIEHTAPQMEPAPPLLTTALKPGSNAYVNTMPTGAAGTGTPLTASGRGSVVEIDRMFQKMWDGFELSPTVLYVNSQELKNITSKVLSNASGPLLRYDSPTDGSQGEYNVTASGEVQFYYNPFAIDGGLRIPIKIQPGVPPGTVIGWAENLPIQYQSNEVPNVAEIKTRQDYCQIDWPMVTRQRQVGVYSEEVLAVYAPFAMGVICNIANG